jgi:hypothetical protein
MAFCLRHDKTMPARARVQSISKASYVRPKTYAAGTHAICFALIAQLKHVSKVHQLRSEGQHQRFLGVIEFRIS